MRKNILTPKLRFSKYSDVWESYELKELLKFFPLKFHLRKIPNEFRNIKIVSYNDICNNVCSVYIYAYKEERI